MYLDVVFEVHWVAQATSVLRCCLILWRGRKISVIRVLDLCLNRVIVVCDFFMRQNSSNGLCRWILNHNFFHWDHGDIFLVLILRLILSKFRHRNSFSDLIIKWCNLEVFIFTNVISDAILILSWTNSFFTNLFLHFRQNGSWFNQSTLACVHFLKRWILVIQVPKIDLKHVIHSHGILGGIRTAITPRIVFYIDLLRARIRWAAYLDVFSRWSHFLSHDILEALISLTFEPFKLHIIGDRL